MTFEEAKQLLSGCIRSELRDHAFGDREVSFTRNEIHVAEGYSGGGVADITIFTDSDDSVVFSGKDAEELLQCGIKGEVERNDSTGPDEYKEGVCMHDLTSEGVASELAHSGITGDLSMFYTPINVVYMPIHPETVNRVKFNNLSLRKKIEIKRWFSNGKNTETYDKR